MKFGMMVAGALLLVAGVAGGDANSQALNPARTGGPGAAVAKAQVSSGLVAQPINRVHASTSGQQVLRAVGALADGGYSVAWVTDETTLSTQRYDSAGSKVGGEVQGPAGARAVSILDNGNRVVAYSATTSNVNTGSFRIFIQMVDPNGGQVLGETLVFSLEFSLRRPSQLTELQVVPLADGGFVVGWSYRWVSSVNAGHFFQTQLFDEQGRAIGTPVVAGSGDGISRTEFASYSLVPDAHGGYVVMRDGTQSAGGYSAVHYDPELAVAVPAMPGKVILLPLEDETYLLFGSDATGAYRQSLDAAGVPGPKTPFPGTPVAASELADGSHVVFWAAAGQLTGQQFSPDGQPLGAVFAVETQGAIPRVAPLAEGGFALAWTQAGANGDLDVYSQRFVGAPDKKNAAKHATKKACLQSAKGIKVHARKQFMDACLAR